jgi:hypothetical protein
VYVYVKSRESEERESLKWTSHKRREKNDLSKRRRSEEKKRKRGVTVLWTNDLRDPSDEMK